MESIPSLLEHLGSPCRQYAYQLVLRYAYRHQHGDPKYSILCSNLVGWVWQYVNVIRKIGTRKIHTYDLMENDIIYIYMYCNFFITRKTKTNIPPSGGEKGHSSIATNLRTEGAHLHLVLGDLSQETTQQTHCFRQTCHARVLSISYPQGYPSHGGGNVRFAELQDADLPTVFPYNYSGYAANCKDLC